MSKTTGPLAPVPAMSATAKKTYSAPSRNSVSSIRA